MSTILKRQGDVLLQKVDTHPGYGEGINAREDGVIARGEVTGHAHVLTGGTLISRYGTLFAVVEDGATARVVHDEHADIELEEGVWLVRTQMEYAGEDGMSAVYD